MSINIIQIYNEYQTNLQCLWMSIDIIQIYMINHHRNLFSANYIFMFLLEYTYNVSYIVITLLVHWNNNPWVDMLLHSDIFLYTDFEPSSLCFYSSLLHALLWSNKYQFYKS